MTPAQKAHAKRMAEDFYNAMPGAPFVPVGDQGQMWGEVETNEHYLFCKLIADRIVRHSGVVCVEPD
jgi:hypothetical protein